MDGDPGDKTVLIITEEHHHVRTDLALSDLLNISRSQCQRLIRMGKVKINGTVIKAKDLVHENDQLTISDAETSAAPKINPVKIDLDIVFEDEAIIVVNKPSGLVVHPGAGTTEPTLIDGVLYYLGCSPDELPGASLRPGVVHRLDKDTSGVMVIAKTLLAHNHLSQQFKDKSNLREYLAVLNGVWSGQDVDYDSYLYRDPRVRVKYANMTVDEYRERMSGGASATGFRYAKSTFARRKSYGNKVTVAQVRLSTGRTHQIRVHAAALNCPVVGDQLYGSKKGYVGLPETVAKVLAGAPRQLLHARMLGIIHPLSQEKLGFEVPVPEDIKEVIFCLEKHLPGPI